MWIINLLVLSTTWIWAVYRLSESCCKYRCAFRQRMTSRSSSAHDNVIKWKHFPGYWPFVRGIHRSPAHSPHKGQWRGALIFSLICVWINDWVNNREAGDLRRYRAHYDVTVMHLLILGDIFLITPWVLCTTQDRFAANNLEKRVELLTSRLIK